MTARGDVARMLTLVPWFLERPGASVHEAADAFGVPAGTIRRDLQHLDFCGLPGLGGGALFDVTVVADRVVVSMADELRRPLRLTPREAMRLVISLQAVDEAMGEELPALRSAIDKVRDAAGLPATSTVAMIEGDHRARWLADLRTALRDGSQVRLSYQGRADTEPRERTVDPWQLDVTADGWYLHGRDAALGPDAHRAFRLDRIADLQVLDRPVEVPRPDGPLPEPRFDAGEGSVEVVVRLGRPAQWLVDAVEPDDVTEEGDDVVMRLRTDAPRWVVGLLLMGAPHVTVEAPVEVARLLDEVARAALAPYGAD